MTDERKIRHENACEVARKMMTAARTAPKSKGMDLIEIAMLEGDEIMRLSKEMTALYEINGMHFFLRDAENILQAEAVILIGTREHAIGLNCGYCGSPVCCNRPEQAPCALNSIDVGIAVGSACATAADNRVDTRVMFSAGYAAQHLGWPTPACSQVIAIPISISSKNPFFDRTPKSEH